MGSWLGYTVYPVEDVSLENLRVRLAEAFDNTVMDVYHHDDPEWVTPWIVEEYDAVGARVSTSPNRIYDGYCVVNTYTVEWTALRDAVVEWLGRCANSIAVAFIVTLHDTSDEGVLCGYRSEDGRLREVRSEDVSYRHDGKKVPSPNPARDFTLMTMMNTKLIIMLIISWSSKRNSGTVP